MQMFFSLFYCFLPFTKRIFRIFPFLGKYDVGLNKPKLAIFGRLCAQTRELTFLLQKMLFFLPKEYQVPHFGDVRGRNRVQFAPEVPPFFLQRMEIARVR